MGGQDTTSRDRTHQTDGSLHVAKVRVAGSIAGDDDPLFVACHVEKHVIVCLLESAFEGMDSVVAGFAEQLSKSRRSVLVDEELHAVG